MIAIEKRATVLRKFSRSCALVAALSACGMAQAQTTYQIAGLADFTGPYADVMKDWTSCRRGVLDWWTEEVGKKQGVALKVKDYDTRYDVAQVASLWPGIKSELNPVAIFGVGGPDTAALQQRLPKDKVPLILSTAGYGFAWKPDSWVFNARPTYPHEAAAFYKWMQKKSGSTAPLKVGVISSEVSPAYVDIHKGVEHFSKDNPGVMEVVETIYTEAQPTDLTQQVARLVRKGATVLQVFNNTASVVAARRALQSLGKNDIPIVMSAHNGLLSSGKALGGLKQLEGSYEVYGMAMATDDVTPTRTYFDKLRTDYKVDANFSSACIMGMSQAMIVVRAIEQAITVKGANGVTGEDVRTAMLSTPLSTERSFGILPSISFQADAPFPTQGISVNIGTVENGKYKMVEHNIPSPTLNKW
jgi:branched-chain amino acid transport system substrate-binding protein